ncbi:MAG TPA: DHA2 family efflux MFS transporter permease subunit [Acetobacteraceae bacterium]|nr:DHA2 family efflux MFS transporter permease subunit [Acetobacteraceae bacterium]
MNGDTPVEREPRLRLFIPLIVASGFFLEQLDSTIITTAIPDMAKALNETPLRLNIALTSYLVTLAVFIPISGWIADRFSMRRTFATAVVVFTIGSIACGFSDSLSTLVASRILQGLGGAMMNPVGRLILLRSFPRRDIVTAMTYVSLPSILGPVIGPLAGGVITTYATWRWIFFVNVPFGVIGVLLALRYIRDVDSPPPARFDTLGFVMCGLGMALFQIGVENLGHPVLATPIIVAIFTAAVALVVIYVSYARRHDNAVLDLSVLRVRSFRIAAFAGGLCRIGLNGVPFLLPLMLQVGFGYTPIQSGSTTFIASLGGVVLRPVTIRLLRALGFDRLMLVGTVFGAAMIASFALIRPTTPYPLLLLAIFIFGFARNIQFNSIQTLTYSDIASSALSRATSLGGVLQQLTMGFGISLSATVLSMIAGQGQTLSVPDFHRVFLALACVPLVALPGFALLRPEDGAIVSGHRRRGREVGQAAD